MNRAWKQNTQPRRPRTPDEPNQDSSADFTRLLDVVAAFPHQTVCVVGDMLLDEFVSGEISRVSREAPVLILRHRSSHSYPGGGANAVSNLASLGARALPVGVVGDDEDGRMLLDDFRGKGIDTSGIIRAHGWVTTCKTRYLAGWTHTTEQQVLRVDREPKTRIPARAEQAVARQLRRLSRHADAVLVSDYGLGIASPSLLRGLEAKILTLDSRYRLLDYRKCGVTAATPNEPELEAAYHASIGTDQTRLEDLGRRALRDLGLEALVVTRGKDGMAVFERKGAYSKGKISASRHIPIFGSDSPVDVTGAGDTVIAAFTLALAAGATYLEAAHIANYAGGIAVMKKRTATVTREELESALRREITAAR